MKAVDRQRRNGFSPNAGRITMIVGSGASDHLVNGNLIPRLRENMREHKKLMEPKVVTAGNMKVLTAAGTIWKFICQRQVSNHRGIQKKDARVGAGLEGSFFSFSDTSLVILNLTCERGMEGKAAE